MITKKADGDVSEKAMSIVIREVEGWGESRTKYPISPEDMIVLLEAGGQSIQRNYDNGDGTFHTIVEIEGRIFETSATKML